MGRYIDDILQPGEKVLYSTTLHGSSIVPGLSCLAGRGHLPGRLGRVDVMLAAVGCR